jgi:hypothetical protein
MQHTGYNPDTRQFGNLDTDPRIKIGSDLRVKSRLGTKVITQELWGLIIGPRRAIEAHNVKAWKVEMEPLRVRMPAVAMVDFDVT